MIKIFLVACCLFIITQISAQSLHWVGTTSNDWNTAANWSATMGGTGGAGIPGSNNQVFIDMVTTNKCTLSNTASIQQLTVSADSLSLTASGNLTVSSNFIIQGGKMSMTIGSVITSNGNLTVSSGTFYSGGGTLSVPTGTFQVSGGLFSGDSATVHLGGQVTLGDPSFLSAGKSTVYFDGQFSQNVGISFSTTPHIAALNKMILNKPGTTLQFNGSTADTLEVQDSMILMDGQLQGTSIFKADKNVWVQSGFDGSAIPITFAGVNNSVLKLDTIFASLQGSSITVKKATSSNTVSFIRSNPTDTIRTGNFNADLTITSGILNFPDNPPVQSRFRNIFIQPGGTLSAPTNFFYNAGAHINTGGIFLNNNGTYVFYQPSIPATTQFTNHREKFNNLIFDITGAQFNTATNDTLEVDGNLTLKGCQIIGATGSAFDLKGNFTAGPAVTFNSGQNTSLIFSGTNDQTVQFATGNENVWKGGVTINKPSGKVNLLTPWRLDASPPKSISFTNGIIKGDSINYLFVGSGYAVTGASAASYVDGKVQFAWYSNFIFPIGNAGFYAPVQITQANSLDTFSAQYFHQNPTSQFDTSKRAASLQNVSGTEYWMFSSLHTVSTPPFVWLSYDNVRSGGVSDPNKLRVSKWNGTQWIDGGNLSVSPPFIQSGIVFATFSPFTLASTDRVANPLPLHLIKFTVTPETSDNLLQWTSTNEENFDKYLIETSEDGMNFNDIGSVKAVNNGLENSYQYKDASIDPKIFYRLRIMVDIDGKYQYSPVVSVDRAINTFTCKVMPNPGNGNFTINISSPENVTGVIRISDANGKTVSQQNISISKGNNAYPYQLSTLPSGLYFINISTSKGDHESIRYMIMKN